MPYFRTFFKRFNKPCVRFLRVWKKTANFRETLIKFSKVFLREFLNMLYFCIFFKKFNKPWVKFLCVWRKTENILEILRKSSFIVKRFVSKLLKVNYLSIFFKKFRNHALSFCAFGGKVQCFRIFRENFESFWWKF